MDVMVVSCSFRGTIVAGCASRHLGGIAVMTQYICSQHSTRAFRSEWHRHGHRRPKSHVPGLRLCALMQALLGRMNSDSVPMGHPNEGKP